MMELLVDPHTHTISSGHAYSTLTENMKAASEKGLKIVAMTDHAPMIPGGCPLYFFDNLRILPLEMFGVRLLKGAEVNIINYNGEIDLAKKTLEKLDFVVASFHPPCIPFADSDTVTKGLIKAMENPLINAIGHPGDARYPLNYKEIALASKRTGTLLEVNNAALDPDSFKPGVREGITQILEYCRRYEIPIMVGSDAHFHKEIGSFSYAIELLESIEFPTELITNTNPDFFIEYTAAKRKKLAY